MRKIVFTTQFIPKFLLFPLFYFLTPVIIILLKVVKILKPSSAFVKKQAKDASSGESLFEATPQILCQVSFLLIDFYPPTKTQIWSIFSSAVTLTYLNVETYLESREKYSLFNLAKFFPLLFLASINKLIIAVGVPMVEGIGEMVIGLAMVAVLFFVSIFLNKKYDLKSEENWQSQRSEFCILSFLTMTNLALCT